MSDYDDKRNALNTRWALKADEIMARVDDKGLRKILDVVLSAIRDDEITLGFIEGAQSKFTMIHPKHPNYKFVPGDQRNEKKITLGLGAADDAVFDLIHEFGHMKDKILPSWDYCPGETRFCKETERREPLAWELGWKFLVANLDEVSLSKIRERYWKCAQKRLAGYGITPPKLWRELELEHSA